MEQDVTVEQALAIIAEHGGYGAVRVYGVIADGESAGQVSAIKSRTHLETRTYSRVYVVSHDKGVMDFIRKL